MSFLIIIILGIIQGACEFLPVSSSGHLVVFYNFFGITENLVMLSIILHVATLLAVVTIYRKQLFSLIKKPFCKTNYLLLTATVPTVVIVLIFEAFIESSFSGNLVVVCFLITALMLLFAELIYKYKYKNLPQASTQTNFNVNSFNITYKQAFFIGLAQGVATLPGISRSGATISAGLVAGVNKNEVASFSFILSVPIILASLVYQIIKARSEIGVFDFDFLQLFVGFVFAFVVGLICLKAMISFVKKQKLYVFSIYLIILVLFLLLNKNLLFWF